MALISMSVVTDAQTPIPPEEKHTAVDSISGTWEDWERVSIDGKLKMNGLPVTPSVKIFMERDKSILISLRAPFLGEVGRGEITDSTILVVNKMKKVYVEESLDSLKAYYPGDLSNLQDIFLGRITFPCLGVLSHEIEDALDFYVNEEDKTFLVVPNDERAMYAEVDYGYVVSSDFWPMTLLVMPVGKPDVSVFLSFDYFEDGYDLKFDYQSGRKNVEAVMELKDPDWDGKPIENIKLNSKFRRVGLNEFIHSF